MRQIPAADFSIEKLETLSLEFSMTWSLDVAGRPMRTVVMVSRAAHCLHDLLFRRQSEGLPVDIVAVVSKRGVGVVHGGCATAHARATVSEVSWLRNSLLFTRPFSSYRAVRGRSL